MKAFLRNARKVVLLVMDLGGVLCILASLVWALNGPLVLALIGLGLLIVGWGVDRWVS